MAGSEFEGTARFELLECLGRGGMGVVYSARDRETEEHVALKVLDTQAPEGLTRFKTEFRSVQSLRHRNLVTLGELVEHEGNWFYTMELVEGVDLHTAVTYGAIAPRPEARATMDIQRSSVEDAETTSAKQPGWTGYRFNEPRLRRLLPQLVAGLEELHRHGKVHRDIKPSNILVTVDDRAVLLDFGMVFDSKGADRVTGTDVVLGTGAYMAPEQARREDTAPTPAADWYALGVLLYEILAGRLPFDGSVLEVLMRKQREEVVPPQVVNPDVPDDLDRLCLSLLDKEPRRRPDVAEIQRRLGMAEAATAAPPTYDVLEADMFVGRKEEIEEIVDLTTTRYGPVTVVVQGESGLGKTSTVDQVIERVRAEVPDAIVLLSRCYERESVPFRGVDNVMDGLSRWLRDAPPELVDKVLPARVESLADAFPPLNRVPAIRRVRPLGVGVVSQHERRARVFETLSQLLSNISAIAQIVIHIDDMQWAGEDTWAVLESLMVSPRRPQVSLFLARRPPEDPNDDPAAVFPDVSIFELEVLSKEHAEDLAEKVLAANGGDISLAAAVAADTRGHPMFVRQLARHLAISGGTDQQPALLEDVLRAQLATLSANAVVALEVLCLAAVPLQQRTLALASGVSTQKIIGNVTGELREAGLARGGGARPTDRVVFFHDRIREVVVDGLDAQRASRLHTRLADALEESGEAESSPEMLVRHLRAAGYEKRAAHGAAEAAVSAANRLAFGQAVALFEVALSLDVLDEAATVTLREQLAETLVNAGRGGEAADVFLALAESASPRDIVYFRRRAAEQQLFTGHLERGLRGLNDVLAEVGESLPATPTRAVMRVIKERMLLRLRPLRWRDTDPSDVTANQRELLELYNAISVGLSLVDNVPAAGYMARHLRIALRVGNREQAVRALALEAIYCASQGHRRRAKAVCARVAALGEHTDAPFALAYVQFAQAASFFFLDSDFSETIRTMAAAEAHVREGAQTTSWESDTARSFQCFCLMFRGELVELRKRLDRYLREAELRGSRYGAIILRARLVLPALAADQVEDTRRELHGAIDDWSRWQDRYLVQNYYALHSHGEIALYADDPESVYGMFAEQEAPLKRTMMLRVAMVKAEMTFMRGRLALASAAKNDGVERTQFAREAKRYARRLARVKVPTAGAWAALLDAGIARLAGPDDGAVDLLKLAIGRLDETQNVLYSMMAKSVLGRTLGGAAGERLRDEADEWANQNGVVDQVKFSRIALPGWYRD